MTEQEYKTEIYAKAKAVRTHEELDQLLADIQKYHHDYGTIVYGCFAAMLGAFNYINRSPSGGITGFQAGCIGWEAVREFLSIKGAARILDFNNLLFPQYEENFEKFISPEVWKDLQEKAQENLANEKQVADRVREHWTLVAAGNVPFGFKVSK